MRPPRARGTPVNRPRRKEWIARFSGYRDGITEKRLDEWLENFGDAHRDGAARLLDVVDFVSNERIAAAFRQTLSSLPDWNRDGAKRRGKWRFAPFSSSSGESGDSMLHRFRWANDLGSRKFKELFIYKGDLPGEKLTPEDTLVLVDDFAGTGNQASSNWTELQELVPDGPRIFLVLVAATTIAIKRIQKDTDLVVAADMTLDDSDNIFHKACSALEPAEKEALLKYCRIADKNWPRGYKDCGLVIVFAHNCPNNSIGVLWADHANWSGLFVRHASQGHGTSSEPLQEAS